MTLLVGVQWETRYVYTHIWPVVKLLSSFTGIYIFDIVPGSVPAGIKLI